MIDSPSSDFDNVIKFIQDEVHLTEVVQGSDELPDTPTLCKALAGPEHEHWNSAICKELTVIREAVSGMGPVPVRPGSVSTGINPMRRGPASLEGPPSLLSQQPKRSLQGLYRD